MEPYRLHLEFTISTSYLQPIETTSAYNEPRWATDLCLAKIPHASKLAYALASHVRGQEFESPHLHHPKKFAITGFLVCRPVNGVTQSDSDFSSSQGAKSAELRSNLSDERRSDAATAEKRGATVAAFTGRHTRSPLDLRPLEDRVEEAPSNITSPQRRVSELPRFLRSVDGTRCPVRRSGAGPKSLA